MISLILKAHLSFTSKYIVVCIACNDNPEHSALSIAHSKVLVVLAENFYGISWSTRGWLAYKVVTV